MNLTQPSNQKIKMNAAMTGTLNIQRLGLFSNIFFMWQLRANNQMWYLFKEKFKTDKSFILKYNNQSPEKIRKKIKKH